MDKRRIHLDPDELKRLYNEEHLGIDAIAARLNTSHGTVWRAMDRLKIARKSLSDAITKHERRDFTGDAAEKAYLIGLRQGDLWVRRNKPGPGSQTIVVSCHTTRNEQLELIESVFSGYGHIAKTHNAGGSTQILCYLNSSFEFLLPKQDAIPAWVLADSTLFFSYLGGYIDAEGSFCVTRIGNASFQLKSCDVGILREIACRLVELGTACWPPRLAQARGSATGAGYKLSKDAYVVSIANKQTLDSFCRLIEPYLRHSKRKNDARQVAEHLQKLLAR